MPTIAISYRRDDTAGVTGRLYDRLCDRFGKRAVFRDIDARIPAGMDFRTFIEDAFKNVDACVCVIGPKWLGPQAGGSDRIMNSQDWVRVEVETALARKIPVVPVMIDDTPIPARDRLPKSLHDLFYREAVAVDQLKDFDVHAQRLIKGLEDALAQQPPREPGNVDRYNLYLGFTAFCALLVNAVPLLVMKTPLAAWPGVAPLHFLAAVLMPIAVIFALYRRSGVFGTSLAASIVALALFALTAWYGYADLVRGAKSEIMDAVLFAFYLLFQMSMTAYQFYRPRDL